MEYLKTFIDIFLHLDKHLGQLVIDFGGWTYLILFIIVFCETGLVVTPFLPGDSLLFAAGAIASLDGIDVLNVHVLFVLLFIAAVIGDAVNYYIGSKIGHKAFSNPNSKIFKKKYLEKTEAFYEKYGVKTIVFARFVPIVRTFAPFLAGVSNMKYSRFFMYNVIGGFLWTAMFTYAGYFFGEIEIVKKNFTLVILMIIFLSILPGVVEWYRETKKSKLQQVSN